MTLLILDLDGTLLDGKQRHYQCYSSILEENGYTPLPVETYWNKKRGRTPVHELLAETGSDSIAEVFRDLWVQRIESLEMLRLDRLHEGVMNKLKKWRGEGRQLLLVTRRKHLDRLLAQLDWLGIDALFETVLVSDGAGNDGGKAQMVSNCPIGFIPQETLWIGDTEMDFHAAENLGVKTVLVTNGLRSAACLEMLGADSLIASVADIELQPLVNYCIEPAISHDASRKKPDFTPVKTATTGGVPKCMSQDQLTSHCRLIKLPIVHDQRGNLTAVESGADIPFDIKRVYYLYDVPGGAERGGHAHKNLHQLIIAMSGSFDILLDDGYQRTRYHMNRSYRGLYVSPMVWREIDNFSSGSVCLVLASDHYDENDYYRDYNEYLQTVKGLK